jgi:uncharacterized FlaG/YvyC family protein
MSFNIGPVPGPYARMASVQATRATNKTEAAEQTHLPDAVKMDVSAIPASPPDEVLDAMAEAAAAHDRLAAADRGLSFKVDDATGKVTVEVHDTNGKVLFTVPGSKALDIAAGGSVD